MGLGTDVHFRPGQDKIFSASRGHCRLLVGSRCEYPDLNGQTTLIVVKPGICIIETQEQDPRVLADRGCAANTKGITIVNLGDEASFWCGWHQTIATGVTRTVRAICPGCTGLGAPSTGNTSDLYCVSFFNLNSRFLPPVISCDYYLLRCRGGRCCRHQCASGCGSMRSDHRCYGCLCGGDEESSVATSHQPPMTRITAATAPSQVVRLRMMCFSLSLTADTGTGAGAGLSPTADGIRAELDSLPGASSTGDSGAGATPLAFSARSNAILNSGTV